MAIPRGSLARREGSRHHTRLSELYALRANFLPVITAVDREFAPPQGRARLESRALSLATCRRRLRLHRRFARLHRSGWHRYWNGNEARSLRVEDGVDEDRQIEAGIQVRVRDDDSLTFVQDA